MAFIAHGTMMAFLYPEMLLLLILVAALVPVYFQLRRRNALIAARFPGLYSLQGEAVGIHRLRRHLSALLFLLALVSLILGLARPRMALTLPFQYDTVILAIDASDSMALHDISPSRFEAAKTTALRFVSEQPSHTRVGVVAFSAAASVVHAPASKSEAASAAIESLEVQAGTALGSAILVSLKLIFPDIEFDLAGADPRPNSSSSSHASSAARVLPASYRHAAIILLTDGKATVGPDPVAATKMAAERGVRIFTVAIGTALHQSYDKRALQEIARATGAKFFHADEAADLEEIYNGLQSRRLFEKKNTEITALFAAAGALFSLTSGLVSLMWFEGRFAGKSSSA